MQAQPGTTSTKVGDVRLQVHRAADAMPAELTDDRATLPARKLVDCGPDVSEASPVSHFGDSGVATPPSNIDHVAGIGRCLSDRKCRRRIAVEAV